MSDQLSYLEAMPSADSVTSYPSVTDNVAVFKGVAGFAALGLCVAGALSANEFVQLSAMFLGAIVGGILVRLASNPHSNR